jgi:hypothetical protein
VTAESNRAMKPHKADQVVRPRQAYNADMDVVVSGWDILDRMVEAVEKVRDRLRRTAQALDAAGVPYAVIGGNAVAAWVARIDPAAVRNTQDVDILLRRADLPAAKAALESAGFVFRHVRGIDMFLDGPHSKARDAVHVIFAKEKVREQDPVETPDVTDSTVGPEGFRHVSLEAIVRMKLTSFRDKDRTHLRDFIGVGLIDQSWPAKFSPPLDQRLQALLDDPDG